MKTKTKKAFGLAFALLSVSLVFFYLYFSPLKNFSAFKKRKYSTDFFDNEGNLVYVSSLENGLRREYSKIEEIPENVKNAFIKAEDRRFFFHQGIDFVSIIRSFIQNVHEKRTVSGASTITMQLSRLINPNEERTLIAKISEIEYSFRLEKRLSKKKILELYLNNVPFGNNIEGVKSASRYFFSKELSDLTLEEAMILSIIPRRPLTYNPKKNPSLCGKQASKVFKYPESLLVKAAEESKKTNFSWPFYFPHLIEEIKDDFSSQKKVFLTLNLSLQKFIEHSLKNALSESKKSRIANASCIVIENETGNILSWIGNPYFYDEKNSGQIDGVLAKNQMGSSMKPFLYASCIEKKTISVCQILPDIPMEFGNSAMYFPRNFNNRYNGPVLVRTALASSLNIPSVYVLSELSVPSYLETLFSLGFDSLKSEGEKNDLGLALGSGEVTLLELATAFSVFLKDGVYLEPKYFKTQRQEKREVFKKDTARIICDILSDKQARATGFGLEQTFNTDYPSIFKTGTANQYQSIVALGGTKEYTIGVWMGNFSGNTVMGKTGSSLPAKVAKETLDFLNGKKDIDFEKPENYKKVKVCNISGMYPNENCPTTIEEYVENSKISEHKEKPCSWHSKSSDGKTETQFPSEYQEWFSENYINAKMNYNSSPLKIISPNDGSIFYLDEAKPKMQKIPVKIQGGLSEKEEVKVYYDDILIDEKFSRPFELLLPVEKGFHNLEVFLGNESQKITFFVK